MEKKKKLSIKSRKHGAVRTSRRKVLKGLRVQETSRQGISVETMP